MRAAYKFLLLVANISLFIPISLGLALFTESTKLRVLRIRLASYFCKKLAAVFSLHVELHGKPELTHPTLMVANHLSYLDVIALLSKFPAVFITSVEVQHSGLLGWLCTLSGCLFVERRSASALQSEIKRIASSLKEGAPIFFFPEATTSDGSRLLPFRKSLFEAALAAPSHVQPFAIHYTSVNRQPIQDAMRRSVFFFGDDNFFPHLFRCLKLRAIHVRVTAFPPIEPKELKSRKHIACLCEKQIKEALLSHS